MYQKANAQQQGGHSLRVNLFSIISFLFLMAFSAGFYIFSCFCSLIAGCIDVLMYQRIFRIVRSIIFLPKTLANRIAILFQGEQHQQQLHEKYQPKQRNFQTSLIRILKNQQLLQGSADKKLLEELRSSKISLQMQNEQLKEKIIEMQYQLNELNGEMEYKNKCMDFLKFDKRKYEEIVNEKQSLENEVQQMQTIMKQNQILKQNIKHLIDKFQSKQQDVEKLERMLQQYSKKAEQIAHQRQARSKQINKLQLPDTENSPSLQHLNIIQNQASSEQAINEKQLDSPQPQSNLQTIQQSINNEQIQNSSASKQQNQPKFIIEQQQKKQNEQISQASPKINHKQQQKTKTSSKNPAHKNKPKKKNK